MVVPVFNEQAAIEQFLHRVFVALASCTEWTVLFVDDGSRDNTWLEIMRARASETRIDGIRFSRNFGKEAAMSAGIDAAHGDGVIVIDVDLQDPPELIPEMLDLWRRGADVVYAARRSRQADSILKRVTAQWFYSAFNGLSTVPIPSDAGDYRLLDGRVIEVLRLLPERSRFMKGLYAWAGFEIASISYDRPARSNGNSKFKPLSLWALALDGLFNFSSKPLRVWTYIGAFIAFTGLLFAGLVIVSAIVYGVAVPGYASIISLLTLFSGIQIVGIGILGEYLSRTFIEAKLRPIYVVDKATVRPSARTVAIGGSMRPELHTFDFIEPESAADGHR